VPILDSPAQMKRRGNQSYTVLSLCRILYTLQHGTVVSKPDAARWARETLDHQWSPLIERTWEGRHNPGSEASSEDVNGTLEFMRYTLERSQQIDIPVDVASNSSSAKRRGSHGSLAS
jgi:hypothetical protein